MPPLIGITTYARDEEKRFSLPAAYVDAVRRAGGIPVLLPPGEPEAVKLLERIDGLIFAGGGDVDPACYAGNRHEAIYNVDAERDQSEIDLVRQVVRSQLPVLGICRGTQVINVALGGDLIEHLPDEVGEAVAHRLPPRRPTEHPVRLEPGTKLATILGQAEITPASWHHQAVRRPASGMRVAARAPDGVIEALEMPGHPWLIAVQWHPELTDDAVEHRLFVNLVKAATRKAD
jgi:putative glutamine amidotransferase